MCLIFLFVVSFAFLLPSTYMSVLDVDALLSAETQDYKYIEIGWSPADMALINGPRTDAPTAAPTITAPRAAPYASALTPPRAAPKKDAPTSASTPQAPRAAPQRNAPTSASTDNTKSKGIAYEKCADIGSKNINSKYFDTFFDNTLEMDSCAEGSADDRCIDIGSDNTSSTGSDLFYGAKYSPVAPPGPGYWKVTPPGTSSADYEWVAGGSLFRTDGGGGKRFKKTNN